MVTSKRRIERDEDRFGGFAEVDDTYRAEAERKEFSDDLLNMRSYVTESDKEEEVAQPSAESVYDTVTTKETTEHATEVRREVTAAPVRKSAREVMPDIMASRRAEKTERKVATPVIKEQKLSPTAKRALVIYMSIVLAVVAGIIATGVAVSSVSAQVTNYESVIAQQEETIALQREGLALLDNASVIADKAEELGMVAIDDSEIGSFDKLGIGGNTEDESGIFDSIRDWFNSVFGG